jgi:hypothetical protein
VSSFSFEDIDSLSKPAKAKYEVSLTGYADIIGNMISISPMLLERKDSNPFKMETRKYPIDYGHPIKSRYVLSINIPEGYEVAELPKSCNIVLPDKSATFTYQAIQSESTVRLTAVFEINKTIFLESDYPLIKEFYNQVIAKQMEVIMLKKKT